MIVSPFIIGALAGAVIGETILLAIPTPRPEPVYTIAAPSVAAAPDHAMVDFGWVRITGIGAWTDGSGARVETDGVDCMNGFANNHHIDLLVVGNTVHVRGHLWGNHTFPTAISFDCEVIPDDAP